MNSHCPSGPSDNRICCLFYGEVVCVDVYADIGMSQRLRIGYRMIGYPKQMGDWPAPQRITRL